VIKNQDDNGDHDPNDDCGGKLRWLITARHVDTSIKGDAVGSPLAPLQPYSARAHTGAAMGFNKRKMEDARRQEAEKEAAGRRALAILKPTPARRRVPRRNGCIG
jgi:hypothetical protein